MFTDTNAFSVDRFADNLELKEPGFWVAKTSSAVSYTDGGNTWCFSVEEWSFWFSHRNRCITDVMKRFPPGELILDIGGGNGFVSLAIEKAGWKVALLEPGVEGALNARARGISTV